MTSIVYLALPKLIKKLDYCLPKPVPDKILKYIRLPKRTLIKYDSPYLEPLPEPVISRAEEKKIQWHNMKVKKQKMLEQLKAMEHQRLQKIETEIENSTKARMQIVYPEHPLEKLLYRPPLIVGCKQEDEEQTIDSHKSESVIFEMEEEEIWSLEEMEGSVQDAMPTRSSSLFTFSESESSHSIQPASEQLPSSSSSSSGRDESADRLPYGWLKADLSMPYNPEDWPDQSSSDDDWLAEEEAFNTTQMAIDFDSVNCEMSMSSANGRAGANAEHDPKSSGEDDGGGVDDEGNADDKAESGADDRSTGDDYGDLCGRAWPAMDERDRRVWRAFGVHGMPEAASFTTTDQSQPTVNTSTRSLWSATMSWSSGGPADAVLVRKQTVLNVVPSDIGLPADSGSVKSSPTSVDASAAEQSRPQSNIEDIGKILDEQVDEIRKLPSSEQLNATLEFLSKTGDPIAGFPELAKLYTLRIWYEKRLNINRYMTSKYKQHIMDKSIAAWNVPRPKLTEVTIPKITYKSNALTWAQINTLRQKIKKVKAEYATNLKHLAINNARDMYLSTFNEYFDNGFNKNFKQTFFAYFPAKEDDYLIENPPRILDKNA